MQPGILAPQPETPIFMNRMTFRISRPVGLVVMLAAMLPGSARGQTLADAAKKASESSGSTKGTTRTFTDKDLKASSSSWPKFGLPTMSL